MIPLPFATAPLTGDERKKRGDEDATLPLGAGPRGVPWAGTRGDGTADARCERRFAGEDILREVAKRMMRIKVRN